MVTFRFHPICAVFVVLIFWHCALGGESQVATPSLWKQGDMWILSAECFPAKKLKDRPVLLKMAASVAREETIAGKKCWLLALIPDGDLPDGTDMVIHAYIDKKTGWPIKIVELDGPFEAKLIPFGDKNVITEALEFFPAELFAAVEPGEFTFGSKKIILTREQFDGQTKVSLSLFEKDAELWRIQQTWKDGELFWHSYEKHLKGRLAFKATAKVDQLARRNDAEKTEQQKADDAAARAAEAKARQYRDAHPLRQDKRLYALVRVLPKRPSVAHVLRQLKEGTGLEMEIDPELETHVPDLGYISPDPKGYLAWQLMEHLTKIEIENARWEKTPVGYRLTGVSTVPPDRQLVTSDDQPPSPARRGTPWLIVSGATLFILMLGAVVVFRRYRGRAVSEKKAK